MAVATKGLGALGTTYPVNFPSSWCTEMKTGIRQVSTYPPYTDTTKYMADECYGYGINIDFLWPPGTFYRPTSVQASTVANQTATVNSGSTSTSSPTVSSANTSVAASPTALATPASLVGPHGVTYASCVGIQSGAMGVSPSANNTYIGDDCYGMGIDIRNLWNVPVASPAQAASQVAANNTGVNYTVQSGQAPTQEVVQQVVQTTATQTNTPTAAYIDTNANLQIAPTNQVPPGSNIIASAVPVVPITAAGAGSSSSLDTTGGVTDIANGGSFSNLIGAVTTGTVAGIPIWVLGAAGIGLLLMMNSGKR